MGSGAIWLPQLHRHSRVEPGDPVMKTTIAIAMFVVLSSGSSVRAQSWEASGLLGFTPSASIDRQATELNDVDIRGDFTWGFQGARFFTPSWGAEVVWTRQA